MKIKLLAAGLFVLSLLSPLKTAAANTDPEKIYIFGDSLSDAGNLYNATKFQAPPSPPYFEGRFSNGKVWVEYLGERLGLKPVLFTNLQNSTPSDGINYAFGGAGSGLFNTLFDPKELFPGALAQVNLFTEAQQADPNALYIVWAGGNDYLFGNVTDVKQPVANISAAIALLAVAGAKNIIVPNLPDLGKIPFTSRTENASLLTALTKKHNQALAEALQKLSIIPGIKIIPLDIESLFNRVQAAPSEFGLNLTNVTDACLVGSLQDVVQGNFSVCPNPDNYLFWDGVHPTTLVHNVIAETALSALDIEYVPKPWVKLKDLNVQLSSSKSVPAQIKTVNITQTL
ncbi:SGNH/GDSL hydrolase family protein [Chlorogloeopsis sp. ULAP02]|uniref:SGNH/GDSL hydrolase family protein n=1 Tax=Chlorogloeopsis sp. ULAP02 TaxID=3107926 RepID=UPI0031350A0D